MWLDLLFYDSDAVCKYYVIKFIILWLWRSVQMLCD
jgi:hypothetical protein